MLACAVDFNHVAAHLMKLRTVLHLIAIAMGACVLRAQSTAPHVATNAVEDRLKALENSVRYADEHLAKAVDDLMWLRRLEEIAIIDKVRFTGPPPRVTNNPTAQGAGNPLVLTA